LSERLCIHAINCPAINCPRLIVPRLTVPRLSVRESNVSHNFKKVVSCACSHRVLSTTSTALFEQKLPQDFCERKNVGFWLKNAWKFTFTWKSERRSNEFLDTILLSSLGIRRRTSIEKKRLCPATDREKVTKCESSGLERVRLQKIYIQLGSTDHRLHRVKPPI